MAEQEQGCYPRVNGEMLQSGAFCNKIISLVGTVVSFDGTILRVKAADGNVVMCAADEVTATPGTVIEAIGAVSEDGSMAVSTVFKHDNYYGCSLSMYPLGFCIFAGILLTVHNEVVSNTRSIFDSCLALCNT